MRYVLVVAGWVAAACGGDSTPHTGPADAAAPDSGAVVDAGDASPPPVVTVNGGCAGMTEPISSYTFPETQVGQLATAWFEIPASNVSIGFDGSTGSLEFDGHTEGVGPYRYLVTISPPAPGVYETTLVVYKSGVDYARIPIRLVAIAPVGGLSVQTPSQQFAPVPGYSPQAMLLLTNRTASTPIRFRGVTMTATDGAIAFSADVSMCPATLQPGDSCYVKTGLGAGEVGCRRNTLTIHSDTAPVRVELEGGVFGAAQVESTNGTVTSNPPGISCSNGSGWGCGYGRFTTPSIELTATPAAGYRFSGWDISTGCGASTSCTVPLLGRGAVPYLTAMFAPITVPTVTVDVQDPAHGRVLVLEPGRSPRACSGSCTFAAQSPSSSIQLVATSRSQFIGWSGACSGSYAVCNLATPTSDTTVVASFGPVAGELATVAPSGVAVTAGAFLPGGDVVLAASQLSRITLANDVVWSRPHGASAVIANASGDIFYLHPGPTETLRKLTAAGTEVWSVLLDEWPPGYASAKPHRLALTASGDIAIIQSGTLRVVSAATGSELWRASEGGTVVAADSLGNVAVAAFDSLSSTNRAIHRYDAAGTRLSPDWEIPEAFDWDIAFDAQDHLAVKVVDGNSGTARLLRFSPTGQIVFSMPLATGRGYRAQVSVLPNGDFVTSDVSQEDDRWLVRRFSPTGALLATLEVPGVSTASIDVNLQGDIVTDSSGRVLLFGRELISWSFSSISTWMTTAWARVMTMP